MNKVLSRLFYFLFLMVVVFAAGEIFVRVKGDKPWHVKEHKVTILPDGELFVLDSVLGYTGRPGSFTVNQNDELHFSLNIDSAGHRMVAQPDRAPQHDSLSNEPVIWIMGCSFTYGWGVNDAETYPSQLQMRLPQTQIVNWGMAGYGTHQSLLQLQEAIENNTPLPDRIILAYGGFHHQRNVASRFWMKAVAPYGVLDGLQYPWVRYNNQHERISGKSPVAYSPWPGMRYSAFIHFLETQYNHFEESGLQAEKVTEELISEMAATCKANDIEFLLAGIYREASTQQMLANFAQKGVPTLDISLDLDDVNLRILPDDGHPNATAHAQFADTLYQYLAE